MIYPWAVPLIQDIRADLSNTFLFHWSCFWKVRMTLPCKVTEARNGFAKFMMCLIPCHQLSLAMMSDLAMTALSGEVIRRPGLIHLNIFWMSRQFRWFSDPVQRVMIFKDVRDTWKILRQRNLQKLLTCENLKDLFNVLFERRLWGVVRW